MKPDITVLFSHNITTVFTADNEDLWEMSGREAQSECDNAMTHAETR